MDSLQCLDARHVQLLTLVRVSSLPEYALSVHVRCLSI